jgi:hypothetical protein
MKRIHQKQFCEQEAARLGRSESWIYKKLRGGFYRGLVIKVDASKVRWICGQPYLSGKPGKVRVVNTAQIIMIKDRRQGTTAGRPLEVGIHKVTCGFKDPFPRTMGLASNKYEIEAPICGGSLLVLEAKLREFDVKAWDQARHAEWDKRYVGSGGAEMKT